MIVLILLLLLLGGGGLLSSGLQILWILLVIGLILWVLGFFVR
ncbi:MAG: hydrophobic protein, partial [Chloroflexi bacterium]